MLNHDRKSTSLSNSGILRDGLELMLTAIVCRYFVTATMFQCIWSAILMIVDAYAILTETCLHSCCLVHLFAVGDWVISPFLRTYIKHNFLATLVHELVSNYHHNAGYNNKGLW
jgi:hypothetical protein